MMVRNKRMLMLLKLIGVWLLLHGVPVMAACTGCNQIVNLTLDNSLSSQTNMPGQTQSSSAFTVGGLSFGLEGTVSETFTSVEGAVPPYGTRPMDWVYQRIDDYLSVGVAFSMPCGTIYAPFSMQVLDASTCTPTASISGEFVATTWKSSIKINRKMVGGVYQRNVLLGTWSVCQGVCNSQQVVIAKVYLNYSITVPEQCVLNAGNVLTMDFGTLSTGAFKTAGAKPEGVNPIARSVALQCSNLQQRAALTMRVQADNVIGSTIVSDNPDVGFVVTDNSNTALTPNLSSSVIPFNLDDNGSARVTIKSFPVSVTGQRPADGPVSSRAYLRVDFQ